MDRFLIDYLPPVLQKTRELYAIMEAEQPEFELAWNRAGTAMDDQFIHTATVYGISRWEAMLDIRPKATDDLEARRFEVLTRLNEKLPYTILRLRQMLAALCGEDGYSVVLENDIYTLFVRVALAAKANYDSVESMLHRVVPANIVIDLSLLFNTHQMLTPYTHARLSALTHLDIREEVLPDA